MSKTAIIIGAGPAGLTAAFELLHRTDIKPVILEKSGDIGGISKTKNYKGNRMDIGGHRFFSKSDRVMEWWLKMMPLASGTGESLTIHYQNKSQTLYASGVPCPDDKVMLVRRRLSRIYFLRKFFAYPIQLSVDTVKQLGATRTIGILLSYLKARISQTKPEKNLEDFFINRFGKKLYELFFKDYTEKVWGVPCTDISAEWGAQRIKGISIGKAISHAVKSLYPGKGKTTDITQKGVETSMIEKFLYPKFGPGQLWEEVARQIQEKGGTIYLKQQVTCIHTKDKSVTSIEAIDASTGKAVQYEGDYFFSTMPIQELIAGMGATAPANVREVAEGLEYRDFITVGVLMSSLPQKLPDTWLYIQERDVKVGRIQLFHNWSPFMVKEQGTYWLGMEYFCNTTDDFWKLDDKEIAALAIEELQKMGLARSKDIIDSTVLRMEKTYPAYFGTYSRFGEIREYLDDYSNLYLIGRNGMHKYNNSDHSMLTAMVAVDNIAAGVTAKANLWAINTEQEYHEEKAAEKVPKAPKVPSTPAAGFRLRGPFWDYLWNNSPNRAWLIAAVTSFVIQFVLFKIKYPFANYMPDSYSYLEAAATNADVNMWPVAYSKFLRLISVFTHSDKAVVAIQYFFMQFSALIFLFSTLYLLKPGKIIRNILSVFFILDPAMLYMSNYISADSLFTGLSFLWLSSLLWIVFRPGRWQIPVQAILLLACFTVRYNAIYYPLIAAFAFLLSKYRWYGKLAGIVFGCCFVLGSIWFTSSKMKEVTGTRQFSAFGGWQLANNALYMYQNIPARDRGPVPARFAKLEVMVDQHMDTLNKVKLTAEDTVSARFYLWSPKGPLIQYLDSQWKKDSTTPYFKRWASEAPLFMDYGSYLIKKYPKAFLTSVLFPNTFRYAVPPPEFLAIYNMGKDSVGMLAKSWFNYKSPRVKDHNTITSTVALMRWYSPFASLANALFLICLVGLLIFKGFSSKSPLLAKVTLLVTFTWLCNAGFSILVSPITLRYQLFPIVMSLTLAIVLISKIYELALLEELKPNKI